MRRTGSVIVTCVFTLTLAACGNSAVDRQTAPGAAISGRLEAGLRVLTLDPAAADQKFTIYRGDYVRIETTSGATVVLAIPALDVAQSFPPAEGEPQYVKIPDAGTYPFTAGTATGVIEAIEYQAPQYAEVSAKEAAALIANRQPFILDVRTAREFGAGHLEGASLVPVQDLHGRLSELAAHKREPVLVYCATGNRSTVAAKLLIDAGFEQVYNVRRGIGEWSREGLPVVR